ncbi:VaFE repeat-containing surface-anchored protein [Nocardioides sp. AE5]|uniref:VaFE repeat-containing surface-anchored protein n=1 Tax=Nocardioides sp. AE5 TaxID=2962573 RepID=UPI0028814BA3|nr:VaFE repeat-containing surface-anchored protein [Nocardioides sp. AE5]MDT0203416.1 VaFE repeat-containing surface-anchored protein [Nocardioides sp. AE5]
MSRASAWNRFSPRKFAVVLLGLAVTLATVLWSVPRAEAVATPEPGDTVHIGEAHYISGSAFLLPIYLTAPSDPNDPGEPDFWAYCIEQAVSMRDDTTATVGELDSFIGTNYFTDPAVQAKVLWVLAHGYPALDLAEFAAEVNIPGLTRDEAISGMTTAIWRYTDVNYDASYHWISDNAEDVYWHLVNGANASTGLSADHFDTTVTITPPADAPVAGTLAGPWVVHTNKSSAQVSVDPALTLVDATGAPVDASAVVDGQELYLDLSGTADGGSATLTATVRGSGATGMVTVAPSSTGGTPTSQDHAQSLILVAAADATTDARADIRWAAAPQPRIGTSLVDAFDGDKYVAQTGGRVIDTVAYTDLTPNTEYTVTGELMDRATGAATGLVGTTTFTASATGQGTVEVEFTIDDQWAGHTLTAFEVLRHGTAVVATHEDIDDVDQTVHLADVRTTLVDEQDGDKEIAPGGGTVIDTVSYTNLLPGAEFTVSGELHDAKTGEATGITGSTVFTASASGTGTVDVAMEIGAGWAGHTLVAFETVTRNGQVVAVHHDLTDGAQTIVVAERSGQIVDAPETPRQSDTTLPATGLSGWTLPAALGGVVLLLIGTVLLGRLRFTTTARA